MEPDRGLVDRVADEAYALVREEAAAPWWRRLSWAFRGGFDPRHVNRVIELAEGNDRVLVAAHHWVWKKHRDPVARRAVSLLQEAIVRVLDRDKERSAKRPA